MISIKQPIPLPPNIVLVSAHNTNTTSPVFTAAGQGDLRVVSPLAAIDKEGYAQFLVNLSGSGAKEMHGQLFNAGKSLATMGYAPQHPMQKSPLDLAKIQPAELATLQQTELETLRKTQDAHAFLKLYRELSIPIPTQRRASLSLENLVRASLKKVNTKIQERDGAKIQAPFLATFDTHLRTIFEEETPPFLDELAFIISAEILLAASFFTIPSWREQHFMMANAVSIEETIVYQGWLDQKLRAPIPDKQATRKDRQKRSQLIQMLTNSKHHTSRHLLTRLVSAIETKNERDFTRIALQFTRKDRNELISFFKEKLPAFFNAAPK